MDKIVFNIGIYVNPNLRMLACNSEDLLIKYDFPSNLQKLLNSFIYQFIDERNPTAQLIKFQINSDLKLNKKCYSDSK